MKKIIAILAVGLLGGGAAGWFGHERLAPQLGLDGEEIEALIIEERAEEERLVLTLEAGERTLLISFIERRQDVAALVAEGDTILVRVPRSGPFADDPAIVEVRRAEGHASDDVASEDDDPDADEELDAEESEAEGEEAAADDEDDPAVEDEEADEPDEEVSQASEEASEAAT
ncbi:MAG: hypothetical protein AB8I08_00855 [Sandaracinaceae bacterium]